jgi:hypothetical protein
VEVVDFDGREWLYIAIPVDVAISGHHGPRNGT